MAERVIVGGPRYEEPDCAWWEPDQSEDSKAKKLFDTVRAIEQRQASIAEGHKRHGEIYAAYCPIGLSWGGPTNPVRSPAQATRNVIRSVCDTATALISKTWPRPRIVTDGGDWDVQQRADQLDRFLVGIYRRAHIYKEAQVAFRDSTIFGTGAYILRECGVGNNYHIESERILISDLIVDELDCPNRPEEAHDYYLRRVYPIKRALKLFGKSEETKRMIRDAAGKQPMSWPADQHLRKDQVVIVEAWHLGYDGEAGEYIKSTEAGVLDITPWKHPWVPIVVLYWSPPVSGFYGDGVAYRQYGRQKRINYLYRWLQRCQDLIAVPRVWVDAVNGPLKVQVSNEIGEIVGYRGQKPEFQTPEAAGPEMYNWLDRLEAGTFDDEGINQATSQGELPKGIESAPAQRELSFKEGGRFAPVSQRWEDAVARETAEKCLALYKAHYEGHADAGSPRVTWSNRTLVQEIDWDEVDLETEQYEIRVEASSLEDLSPAGRLQAVIELAQTGWIEPGEGRELIGHPDLMKSDEKANAAIKYSKWISMNLKHGKYVPPNGYGDLEDQRATVAADLLNAEMGGATKSSDGLKAMNLMRQFLRDVDSKMNPKPDDMPMPGVPGAQPPIDPNTGMPAGIQAAPAPAMSLAAAQGLAPMTGQGFSRQNM